MDSDKKIKELCLEIGRLISTTNIQKVDIMVHPARPDHVTFGQTNRLSKNEMIDIGLIGKGDEWSPEYKSWYKKKYGMTKTFKRHDF